MCFPSKYCSSRHTCIFSFTPPTSSLNNRLLFFHSDQIIFHEAVFGRFVLFFFNQPRLNPERLIAPSHPPATNDPTRLNRHSRLANENWENRKPRKMSGYLRSTILSINCEQAETAADLKTKDTKRVQHLWLPPLLNLCLFLIDSQDVRILEINSRFLLQKKLMTPAPRIVSRKQGINS